MIDVLNDLGKPRSVKQTSEIRGRGMLDLAFHGRDADVIDEPSPEAVTASVESEKTTSGLEDAMHLRHGTILVRVVVEAVGARDDVERPVPKRQALAVALDGHRMMAERMPPRASAGEHVVYEVYTTNAGQRQSRGDAFGEYAGAATNVED